MKSGCGSMLVVAMAIAAAFELLFPRTLRAEIVERELGTNASGEVVKGYVFQAGRKRTSNSRSYRYARTGYRYGYGSRAVGVLPVYGGYVVRPSGVRYGVSFCQSAGRSLASLSFRGVQAGGRFSFKLGF